MKIQSKLFWLCVAIFTSSCDDPAVTAPDPVEEDLVITDWTDQTHGNDVAPDYATVFP
jgi:hypothetical protein